VLFDIVNIVFVGREQRRLEGGERRTTKMFQATITKLKKVGQQIQFTAYYSFI